MQRDPLHGLQRGDTVLEARGITKRFPGVLANDRIDFEMRAGEIHAILGENGAGKTTLMKILYGLVQPDEGEIYVGGQRVKLHSPLDAIDLGIGASSTRTGAESCSTRWCRTAPSTRCRPSPGAA